MTRADINLSNNEFNNNRQNQMNNQDFEGVWQNLDDVSEISFELLLPKQSIKDSQEGEQEQKKDEVSLEETLMRQNLVDLAIKENIVVKKAKDDKVNIFVKSKNTEYTKAFTMNLPRMTEDDVVFFQVLAGHQNVSLTNENELTVEENGEKKTLSDLKFSKSFINLLEYSFKSQKPIRIDFDSNASVILRIDGRGKVSAEFIASDKVMEHLLKTNIPQLKKKLDSSGIKYKKIYYRDEEEE